MNLVRWQPFPEFRGLSRAMDRLFADSYAIPHRFQIDYRNALFTPIDMYQTEGEVVVKAALPGMKPEEVDITIADGRLNIKGETKAEDEANREDYLYREHRYGTFSRSVALPDGLDTDKAEAGFDDGILTLTIPKSGEAKPKQVEVKAKKAVKGKK